jgi:16S rRNA (cytidine1402-2'-O)-methyltransferase
MTFRAVETLKSVDYVACEDTRHTLQLLNHFEIKKPLISCRAQNEKFAGEKILKLLDDGFSVAYASDAGTPGISDPGAVLVDIVRENGHGIVPIPGPAAFATLVSVAGSGGKTLIFEGFLSPKPGKRRTRLKELMQTGDAIIIYESPFRIVKLLTDVADIDSKRRVVVGRELTKLHEEILSGTAEDVKNDFAQRTSIKGEFAIFISGVKKIQNSDESTDK